MLRVRLDRIPEEPRLDHSLAQPRRAQHDAEHRSRGVSAQQQPARPRDEEAEAGAHDHRIPQDHKPEPERRGPVGAGGGVEGHEEQRREEGELEDEQRSLGQSRYHSRDLPWKVAAGTLDEEANMPPGHALMKAVVVPVTEAIEAFLKEACERKAGRLHRAVDFLLLSEPKEVAYLTTRVMVNLCMSQSLLQTAATKVTEAMIENLEFRSFREMNRKGYKGFMKAQEARGFSRQRKAAVKKLEEMLA